MKLIDVVEEKRNNLNNNTEFGIVVRRNTDNMYSARIYDRYKGLFYATKWFDEEELAITDAIMKFEEVCGEITI